MSTPTQLCGVVVSAGKMMRAVKVRTAVQVYNNFLRKQFLTHQNHLVSDPNSSLRVGDVVKFAAEGQVSKQIKHVVTEIVAPWGSAIEERPLVRGEEERMKVKREKREAKLERRKVKGVLKSTGGKGKKDGGVLETVKGKGKREGSREAREPEDDRVVGVMEGTMVAS